MIGLSLIGWTREELQRVADATTWSSASTTAEGDVSVWATCLRGHQFGGDKYAAMAVDANEGYPAAEYTRNKFGLRASQSESRSFHSVAFRFDNLCWKYGQGRVVTMIQNRARKILASRTIATMPVPNMQETCSLA